MNLQDIGWAVKQMHNGDAVRRSGWNGKGMWLVLVTGPEWRCDLAKDAGRAPFVAMKTADGMFVPWLCSQTDLLAVDWETA